MGTARIIEIQPQIYAIQYAGHTLRQHYFTKQAAQQVVRTLK